MPLCLQQIRLLNSCRAVGGKPQYIGNIYLKGERELPHPEPVPATSQLGVGREVSYLSYSMPIALYTCHVRSEPIVLDTLVLIHIILDACFARCPPCQLVKPPAGGDFDALENGPVTELYLCVKR